MQRQADAPLGSAAAEGPTVHAVNGYPVAIGATYIHTGEYGPNEGTHPHLIEVRGVWAGSVLAITKGVCQWSTCQSHPEGAEVVLSGFDFSPTNPRWVKDDDTVHMIVYGKQGRGRVRGAI